MVSAAGGRRPGWMYCRWCGGPVSRVAAPAVGRGCSQLWPQAAATAASVRVDVSCARRVIGSKHCDELRESPEPTALRSAVAPAADVVTTSICSETGWLADRLNSIDGLLIIFPGRTFDYWSLTGRHALSIVMSFSHIITLLLSVCSFYQSQRDVVFSATWVSYCANWRSEWVVLKYSFDYMLIVS